MSDVDIGRKAIKTYYDTMRFMYPSSFKYSEAEFLAILQKLKGGKMLLDGLGMGIRESGMSDSRVSAAMRNLAKNGGGKIPASYMDFFNALTNESAKISYVDAAIYTVKESAKDVLNAAQSVGNQIILTGKVLNFLLPVILLGAVYFWLDGKSGGRVTSTLKGLRK